MVIGSNDPIPPLEEEERSGEDEDEVNGGWGKGFDVYPAVPPEHLKNNP